MIIEDKVLVIDIDGTICEIKPKDKEYIDIKPKLEVIKKINEYKQNGFHIILYTSRQMRTYEGNLGKINANTAKIIFEWLEKYDIPYDEIYFGKPWCGKNGFYIDDKAIRPREFRELSFMEINKLIERDV